MERTGASIAKWLFGPGPREGPGRLWPRWLFLRALGLIFFSAFYSLLFQIRGLIGPLGILPAGPYLEEAGRQLGWRAYWLAPTLYWLDSSGHAMLLVTVLGLAASLALVFNLWPRGALAVCLLSYLSFVTAAQDFSSYQSDGMLLAAGFLSLFFAPPGMRPGLGEDHPPSRASLGLLQWEWFRIYFESGLVKLASGDPEWHHLTALDHYYSNGPLPNWIGWYVQQLPHAFHAATALATLAIELGIVWMLFLPRRWRILCFFIVTPFQIGIILTANLAFINHLVLVLGVLLLDDRFLRRGFAKLPWKLETGKWKVEGEISRAGNTDAGEPPSPQRTSGFRRILLVTRHLPLATSAILLTWIFYDTLVLLLLILMPRLPLPPSPITALEPFRIANQYGLFAVMTRGRYEIEFQGSRDGADWVAYPFRYKPQDPSKAPGFYAPYQPRFDWNLWFASLGPWRESPFVVQTEELLLSNDPAVLGLFAGNPFPQAPPMYVRAVMWRYWFTGLATRRRTGWWWNRELLGLYAPELSLRPDGQFGVVAWPTELLPPPSPPLEP
jgi:Lipase maturation factor